MDSSANKTQPEGLGAAQGLLDSLSQMASQLSSDAQRLLSEALRALSIKLETPNDTIHRILNSPMELSVTQIGVDMGLFHALVDSKEPLSVAQLAEKTKADAVLVARLCRFLASYHAIQEVDEDLFTASHVTHTLTQKGYEAGVAHHFYLVNPGLQALPKSLQAAGYTNPSDPKNCAFNAGHNTSDSLIEWIVTHPTEQRNAGLFLNDFHTGKTAWTSTLPLLPTNPSSMPYLSGTSATRPLFIDVGGGFGIQASHFASVARSLSLPGKIVVQDMASTLAAYPDLPDGIEKQAIDFFVEQPVAGAKFYYMRNVLHDHPDEAVVRILRIVKEKMAADSLLLIDEKVVPDKGAHRQCAQMDVVMMASLAAMERTERQWMGILREQLGFVVEVRTYERFAADSVIECRLA